MGLYLLLILVLFPISFLELFNYKKVNIFIKYLNSSILLFIFILLAFNRGNADYGAYLEIFKNEVGVEVGYLYMIKIIKFFGGMVLSQVFKHNFINYATCFR